MPNLREMSRSEYVIKGAGPTFEELNAGGLQRIADAVEKVAVRHTELMRDRDYYKQQYENERARCNRFKKANAALRGHLRRVKAGAK